MVAKLDEQVDFVVARSLHFEMDACYRKIFIAVYTCICVIDYLLINFFFFWTVSYIIPRRRTEVGCGDRQYAP